MVKFVAALVLLGYFAQNTISQEIPWENRYLDVSAAVELGLSSGTIIFPDEGSFYGSNTRLRYTIHGGEVSLQFSRFAFEHSYDGVSITFQRENNVAEEYLFSDNGGHGKRRKKRSAKQFVNSEKVRSSGAGCDGDSSFQICYGSDYENAESWVGSGSGNITIEIFTDESHNLPGFELVWSLLEDEPTTAEPSTAEPTTAEATTAEPTTAEPTTEKPRYPWENKYIDVSAGVEFGVSSGIIKFPNEGSHYSGHTRLRYHISGGEVSLQFSRFFLETRFDGVSITFQRENNVSEEYLFSHSGDYDYVDSEIVGRIGQNRTACDTVGSSFESCYGTGYGYVFENAETWVGSGSGNITVEIFTDSDMNYSGFELAWSLLEDEPTTAEATTPEATTGQASTADVITTEASDLCELVDCHSGQCEVVFPDYYYTHSIHTQCVCPFPFTGQFCDTNSDPCNYNDAGEPIEVCQNGAECYLSDDTPYCNCNHGFTGESCETAIYPCADLACSHACYDDAHDEGHCACPKGFDVGEDGLTCEENSEDNSEPNEVSDQFIDPEDGTWRPLIGHPEYCVVKKYSAYSVGQPYQVGVCNADKRKSKFAYDVETGFLHHHSDRTEWTNFCVTAQDGNKSRLKTAICDASDDSMIWDYDSTNGHVHLRSDRKRCIVVGPIPGDSWMKISNRCATNAFGRF